VPPLAVVVAVPVFDVQALAVELALAVITGGCVMENVLVIGQLFASVIVQV
jgi:hypothetical protein